MIPRNTRLRAYGVDAAAMSFWLHDGGIHAERVWYWMVQV
jgi:hypothetical protein